MRFHVRTLAAAAAATLAAIVLASPAAADTQPYSVTMTTIEGSTDDHLGNWEVKIGEISGGDPAVELRSTAPAGPRHNIGLMIWMRSQPRAASGTST